MRIKETIFLKSITDLNDCPVTAAHDFAFIGRSNVGKSSLINMLVERKQLAKTSGKPGKTQTINFFLVNNQWHLVDLPGYGWAGVSRDKKNEWIGFVRNYLLHREKLYCLFIIYWRVLRIIQCSANEMIVVRTFTHLLKTPDKNIPKGVEGD